MGRTINQQMAKSGFRPTSLIPELKFFTLNQVKKPAFVLLFPSPVLKNKWTKTRQVPVGLGSSLGSSFLGEPSFPVHCCPSGAGDQRPAPELSDRKGYSLHFFLSSPSAKDWFQKGSVKTIVKKRRIFPSSSWVRPSKRVENGGPW